MLSMKTLAIIAGTILALALFAGPLGLLLHQWFPALGWFLILLGAAMGSWVSVSGTGWVKYVVGSGWFCLGYALSVFF
jgi:hypothetical protein